MRSLSSPTNELIAIDPSIRALGWAYFYAGKLMSAGTVKAESLAGMMDALWSVRRGLLGGSSCEADVVIEQPKIYPVRKWKGDPNDMIQTAMAAGAAAARFDPCGGAKLL